MVINFRYCILRVERWTKNVKLVCIMLNLIELLIIGIFSPKKVKNTQTYRTALLKNSFNWHVTPNLFLSPAWKKIILCRPHVCSLWFFALLCKKGQSCKIYHRIICKWIIEKCHSQGGQNEAHKNRTFN